ncbi:MAG TPA: biopolymer transporter ExbD [Gammaproteobacteria bacterium]|nr:biopolymer transporter ExbD [Gammaproteobacteria bacterium]
MDFDSEFDSADEAMSEINMTPLVDVMLVLLIIFMLAVPVMTHTVRVELPQAGDHRNDIEPQVIHLTVTEEGKIEWENEAVSHHLLQSRLQAAAQQQPQPAVHLSGDRNVAYEHVVKVMATVEQAGLYKLGFLTQIE